MLEAESPSFDDGPHSLDMADGLTEEEGARYGAQNADAALEGPQLVVPVEEVQDHAKMDNVDSGHHAVQGCVGVDVEDVGVHELRLQRRAVAEQLVAHVNEVRLELRAVECRGRRPVKHQPPQVLGHTAPHIKQRAALVAQLGEDARIRGEVHHGQVEEPELADARVCVDLPGLVALKGTGLIVRRHKDRQASWEGKP